MELVKKAGEFGRLCRLTQDQRQKKYIHLFQRRDGF
jgi:hypothetical protein